MARMVDDIYLNDIEPPKLIDLLSKDDFVDYGKAFRELMSQLDVDASDEVHSEFIQANPAVRGLLGSMAQRRRNKPSILDTVRRDLGKIVKYVESVASDEELGRFLATDLAKGVGYQPEDFLSPFDDVVVFHIDNVAQFLEARHDAGYDLRCEELGSQAPLHTNTFFEFSTKGTSWPGQRAGVLVEVLDNETVLARINEDAERFQPQVIEAFKQARWILEITTVIQLANGKVIGPVMSINVPLKADGRLTLFGEDDDKWYPYIKDKHYYDVQGKRIDSKDLIRVEVLDDKIRRVAQLAISYAHSRDTVQKVHAPDPKNLKATRKHRVKYGREPESFRVLEVPHMKEETEGLRKIAAGSSPGLHFVIGHFKHYKDEPGHRLFGKHGGVDVHHPGHVRGDEEKGIRAKDYSVSPPAPPVPQGNEAATR